MPVELGSFDVIIGMDWLTKYHAVIVCDEKIVRVPFGNEILIVRGDRSNNRHESLKTSQRISNLKMYQFLDIYPVVGVVGIFTEDLSVYPPTRQVEFKIDLIPGVAPVARAPYRLALAEMQELSDHCKELSDKGFIRPISSPWGAPVLFVKKKDGSFRGNVGSQKGNQAQGMVKPEIRGNVNFEIKSQFMRELREDTFSRNKNDDTHEHVERVLDIISLFNIPGVSHDAVMLRVFPITLTGAAKRWVDRLPPGTINSWDLLKKAFI
ncbi:hypothetical protein Tco_0965532 [Tanacetum coccineum]